MKFLSQKISKNTYANIMSQYRPMGEASKIRELARPVTQEEFRDVLKIVQQLGLNIIQ